jgi:hypothetical protein
VFVLLIIFINIIRTSQSIKLLRNQLNAAKIDAYKLVGIDFLKDMKQLEVDMRETVKQHH